MHFPKSLIVILLLTAIVGADYACAQTYYYRRVKIVDENNGGKTVAKNDDAHYITFNRQSCYDSDAQGMASAGADVMRYVKSENGISTYWGASIYGADTYCLLNRSTGRVNMRQGGKVYVYERVGNPSSCTAARRAKPQTTPAPVIIHDNSDHYKPAPAQRRYPGKRVCPGCNGSGRNPERIEYTARYVNEDVWCSKCGKWMAPHVHIKPLCRVCYGKGYVGE